MPKSPRLRKPLSRFDCCAQVGSETLGSLRRCNVRSAEVADQYHIAGDFSACHQQLLPIEGPVEIENNSGGEVGQLFGFSSRQRLLPDVRRPIPKQGVLQALALE